jgi:hypothetical protein
MFPSVIHTNTVNLSGHTLEKSLWRRLADVRLASRLARRPKKGLETMGKGVWTRGSKEVVSLDPSRSRYSLGSDV